MAARQYIMQECFAYFWIIERESIGCVQRYDGFRVSETRISIGLCLLSTVLTSGGKSPVKKVGAYPRAKL